MIRNSTDASTQQDILPLSLHRLVRVITVPSSPSSSPEDSPHLEHKPINRSLGISVKCETSDNVDHGDEQKFELEFHGEIDDVEEQGDRPSGAKKDVRAETAKEDEAEQKRCC